MHFTTLWLWWLRLRCLPNIWWLMTTRRNFHQPVLVRIYCNFAIVEAWLSFMTCIIRILRTLLSQAEVSVHYVYRLWSPCRHWKHDLYDCHGALWWIPRPLLPWDDDDNIYIEWYNIFSWNRKKHQSLLLRWIGSDPGPSSPPSCFLSWHGD